MPVADLAAQGRVKVGPATGITGSPQSSTSLAWQILLAPIFSLRVKTFIVEILSSVYPELDFLVVGHPPDV